MDDTSDIGRLRDESEIRRLFDEYCLRLEVNPFEEWLDLFTDDTVYEVHRRVLNGKAEMAELLRQAPHGVHIGGAARVTIDGDVAETIQNYHFIADEEKAANKGWYYRRLVRTEAGWKIAHTRVEMRRLHVQPKAAAS